MFLFLVHYAKLAWWYARGYGPITECFITVSGSIEFRTDYILSGLESTASGINNEIIYHFVEQVLIEFSQWERNLGAVVDRS